jgi:dTDP-4-amino-4,6-dideoxygalactose transaminase
MPKLIQNGWKSQIERMTEKPVNFCDFSIPEEMESNIWTKARELIKRNGFILDREVEEFESEFAMFCETSDCVGVATGCDALLWVMEGLGIGKGDEVITVANTFIGSVLPILRAGATPVLVDCDPLTQQIDADQVAAAVTPQTTAILAVHLYGRLAPMDQLLEIAENNGLALLEDAAQAHGARYRGKRTGSLGHASGFSFYPAKNLGAWGDGGALVTSDHELASKIKRIRNYGQKEKYKHLEKGWNSRLDSIQAIVLREKLKLLDGWNERRRQAAEWYYEQLEDAPVITFREDDRNEPVHHLFVVQMSDRDKVQKNLQNQGIQTGIHYPIPIHKHECFENEAFAAGKTFPQAEKQATELLSLPMHPKLRKEEVISVIEAVKNCLNR